LGVRISLESELDYEGHDGRGTGWESGLGTGWVPLTKDPKPHVGLCNRNRTTHLIVTSTSTLYLLSLFPNIPACKPKRTR
jgi:hypothetical protein